MAGQNDQRCRLWGLKDLLAPLKTIRHNQVCPAGRSAQPEEYVARPLPGYGRTWPSRIRKVQHPATPEVPTTARFTSVPSFAGNDSHHHLHECLMMAGPGAGLCQRNRRRDIRALAFRNSRAERAAVQSDQRVLPRTQVLPVISKGTRHSSAPTYDGVIPRQFASPAECIFRR